MHMLPTRSRPGIAAATAMLAVCPLILWGCSGGESGSESTRRGRIGDAAAATVGALEVSAAETPGSLERDASARAADPSRVAATTAHQAMDELPPEVRSRFEVSTENLGKPIRPGAFDYTIEMLDLDLKDVVREIEIAFESLDPKRFGEAVAENARGSVPGGVLRIDSAGASRKAGASEDGGILTAHGGASSLFADGRTALAEAIAPYFEGYEQIYDGFTKVKEYVGEPHSRRILAKAKQDVRGILEDGSVHQEHLVWKMAFRRTDEASDWEIDRIFLIERHQKTAPKSQFREVTTAAGLYATEPPSCSITGLGNLHRKENLTQYDYGGICVYDIDGDGWLDVFMPNAYGPFGLFMNKGDGTFENRIEDSGIVSHGGTRGAVFGDLDNDGDADLYICRAPFHHPSIGRASNSLFENLGDGKFREVTIEAGVLHRGASMSATFVDYDLDSDLDIFVVDYGDGTAYGPGTHHPYNATHGLPSHLYRNDGGMKFTDVTKEAGLGNDTYWSYAVAVVDWNKDRYPDLYVANDFGPNNFYVNQGDGTFRDRAEELGVLDVGNGMGAAFVDYDQDSRWDLYVTNMQSSTGQRVLKTASELVTEEDLKLLWKLTLGNSMFRQREDGTFAPSNAPELGINNCQWAWHADFADFDADADQDLVVVNGYYSGVDPKDC